MPKNRAPFRHRFRFEGRRYSVTAWSERELWEKVARKKAELENGRSLWRSMSVAAWRDEWLETYKAGKVSPHTLSSYRSALSHLDLQMPVADVRPVHLQRALNNLAGSSDSQIHKFCVLTKALFAAAVDNGLCRTNPAEKLERPRCYTRPRRPLNATERRLIEAVAPSHPAGRFVALMLYAGCRPGEAGIVQGSDVDLETRRLHIRGTKTPAADRFVPISDRLLPYLVGLAPDELAVVNASGGPTTKYSRQGLWRRFVRDLNIAAGAPVGRRSKHSPWDLPLEDRLAPDLAPYLLRHTFCTDLEAAGVPINVARDLMGHSSISVTSKIYTHRTDAALDSALGKMNAYEPDAPVADAPADAPPLGEYRQI